MDHGTRGTLGILDIVRVPSKQSTSQQRPMGTQEETWVQTPICWCQGDLYVSQRIPKELPLRRRRSKGAKTNSVFIFFKWYYFLKEDVICKIKMNGWYSIVWLFLFSIIIKRGLWVPVISVREKLNLCSVKFKMYKSEIYEANTF